jgi:aldehyde dehydrogenase (NAD+)
MITYETEEEAVAIANDTTYGLAGYVQGTEMGRVRNVAERIRAGRIDLSQWRAPGPQRPVRRPQAIRQWP